MRCGGDKMFNVQDSTHCLRQAPTDPTPSKEPSERVTAPEASAQHPRPLPESGSQLASADPASTARTVSAAAWLRPAWHIIAITNFTNEFKKKPLPSTGPNAVFAIGGR